VLPVEERRRTPRSDPVIPSEVLVENERKDDERPQQVAREEWWKLRRTRKLTVDRADLRV